jgi:hypothetical protein
LALDNAAHQPEFTMIVIVHSAKSEMTMCRLGQPEKPTRSTAESDLTHRFLGP